MTDFSAWYRDASGNWGDRVHVVRIGEGADESSEEAPKGDD